MTKAFQIGKVLAGLGTGEYNGATGGYKNKVINGNFGINQRGTSFVVPVNSWRNTSDCWIVRNNGPTITTTPTVSAMGGESIEKIGTGTTNCMKLTYNLDTTTMSYGILSHPIENVFTLAGKTVTLSFWARSETGTSVQISSEIEHLFNGPAGGLATGIGVNKFILNDVWTQYKVSFKVDSATSTNLAANHHSRLNFWYSAGSNWSNRTNSLPPQAGTFYITNVSIVYGDVTKEVDSYSDRHPQQELALCKRYLQVVHVYRPNFIIYTANGDTRGGGFKIDKMAPNSKIESWNVSTDAVIAHGNSGTQTNVAIGTPTLTLDNDRELLEFAGFSNMTNIIVAGPIVSVGCMGTYQVILATDFSFG